MTVTYRFKLRRGTAAEWTTANPVLLAGEPGVELDTDLFKFGDGVTAWTGLDYANDTSGGGGDVDDHINDAVGAHAATAVAFTPAGTIAATTVQAAVVEVATEGVAALAAHEADTTAVHGIADTSVLETTTGSQAKVDAHVNDTSAAHAASAVAFTAVGTIAGTDVQAAVAEVATDAATALSSHEADTTAVHGIANTALLETTTGSQAKVDAHVNDASAAHAATAIAFTPAGSIAATTVQAAIEEVAAEAGVGTTNLAYTAAVGNGVVTSDTGTDATVTAADGTNAGLLLPAGFTKLAGIEAAAEVNDTAAEILTKLLTVDGAGSGLDADLLDGTSSAGFATAAHDHTGTYQPLATVLTNTTAAFTTAQETKLSGIATGATVYTDEMARDALGTALVAGSNVTITPNDGADTITIAATGGTPAADSITNALLDNMAANTVKVNATTGSDNPTDLAMGASTILARLAAGNVVAATPTQLRTLINVEDGAAADQTAAEILAALLTVDGAGSGLDADLLDGTSSAGFATAAQGTTADGAVPKSLYDANTVLYATTDDTPAALTMGASTILARLAAGNIVAATPTQLKTLLAIANTDVSGLGTAATTAAADYATAAQGTTADAAVPKALYDANTVLYATTDNTPAALTVGASTVVGRKASGNIVAMTGAETGALIKLDELAAPTDVTTLNASTSTHGLLKKLSNTATEFMNGAGNWAVPAGGSSSIALITRTADTAARNSGNTGSTLTADDTLLFAVSGNSADMYHFELFLFFNSANATMDAKAGFTVPSGTTMLWGYGFVAGSVGYPGSPASATSYSVTAPLTESTPAIWATATTNNIFARAEGYVYVGGTSGNVVLTWAQNTSDAGNLILKKGSHIRYTKII